MDTAADTNTKKFQNVSFLSEHSTLLFQRAFLAEGYV
jgi:hypothetical protein